MRTLILIFTIAVGLLSLAGCSTQKHESTSLIQGRTVADWVGDVEIDPSAKNPSLEVLVAAGPQAMPDLVRLLLEVEPSNKQAQAVYVMGAIAYRNQDAPLIQEAVPALTKAAQSGDSQVRMYSVQALGAVGPSASKATPILLRLTKDENASVRMCAVEALGRIGIAGPEAVQALIAATTDSSGDVQLTAIKALSKIGRPPTNTVPALIQLAKNESENEGVRCAAVEALGEFVATSPEARDVLNLALSDSSNFVRSVAKQTLDSLQVEHK